MKQVTYIVQKFDTNLNKWMQATNPFWANLELAKKDQKKIMKHFPESEFRIAKMEETETIIETF